MDFIKFIYWGIAYSAGIVNLTIQIIFYLKKRNNFERDLVFFLLSFAVIIVSLSIMELAPLNTVYRIIPDKFSLFGCCLLIYFLPRFAHTAKNVNFGKKVNIIFFFISILLLLGILISFFSNNMSSLIYDTILSILTISIVYSMIILIFIKNKKLIESDKKIFNFIGIICLLIMPGFIILDFFYDKMTFVHSFLPKGFYTLPGFYFFLNITLLADSIKKTLTHDILSHIGESFYLEYGITPREKDVVLELVKGASYKDIGKKLYISMPTVKSHISSIYQKTGAGNKIELLHLIKKT